MTIKQYLNIINFSLYYSYCYFKSCILKNKYEKRNLRKVSLPYLGKIYQPTILLWQAIKSFLWFSVRFSLTFFLSQRRFLNVFHSRIDFNKSLESEQICSYVLTHTLFTCKLQLNGVLKTIYNGTYTHLHQSKEKMSAY